MLDAERLSGLHSGEEKIERILDLIKTPEDLKKVPLSKLNRLAQEIRELIIDTVLKNGGHLAPSLGVVELTIALHYVFETPRDRIIWDVGHQCYPHKILTGRAERFATLRKLGGISGFPKREESIYDAFGTGHASTSISAALGIATARDLKGENFKVIAVIGDGALTGGLAWEGLNNVGNLKKDIIVVLNDNEFSIAPTIGAVSHFLTRRLSDPIYLKIREEVKKHLESKPAGETILNLLKKLEESFKSFFTAGIIFEELGLHYVGPVRGHNIQELISTFNQVKRIKEPVLVHVLTKKGKGYEPAEKEPEKYHGISAYIPKEVKKRTTYTEVFAKGLIKIAENNDKVVAITAAMPDGTGLKFFKDRFPDRFFDVGIAEGHAVTFAAGLAVEGLIPVCAIYSTFLQRAFDQIIHDVALQKLHVVFCLDRAGLVGEDGPTHHGIFDISYLRFIPNMVLMAPSCGEELIDMLYTAIEHCKSPVAIRYAKDSIPEESLDYKEPIPIPIGKAKILKDGEKIAIIGIGSTIQDILTGSEIVERELGISPIVINARFIKPIDEELILEISEKVDLIVTVEDNVIQGGFGSAVLEILAKNRVKKDTLIIGIDDTFPPHGKRGELKELCGIDSKGIARRITEYYGNYILR